MNKRSIFVALGAILLLMVGESSITSGRETEKDLSPKEYRREVDGWTLHAKRWSFQGSPIVFFSGGGEDMGAWKDIIPAFSDTYSVYTVAVSRNDRSIKPEEERMGKGKATRIAPFIQQECEKPVVLIGHSAGAMISIEIAVAHPELVRAVVLEDPPGDITVLFPWLRQQLKIKALPVEERVKHFMDKGRTEEQAKKAAAGLENFDQVALQRLVDGEVEVDIRKLLPLLKCEALFVLGHPKKGSLTQEEYRTAIRQLPHATLSEWSEAGHHPHSTDPQRFVREVKEFLKKVDGNK